MIIEMKLPSPGESITEVEIASWKVADGEYVEQDQVIGEIDSEKATLELTAEQSGAIELLVQEGDTVRVGAVVCKIDTEAKGTISAATEAEAAPVPPVPDKKGEKKKEETPAPATAIAAASGDSYAKGHPSPAARKMMEENTVRSITGTGAGGRITKQDVLQALAGGRSGERNVERQKMSMLRKKLSQRLVAVKNETAMLTTFNEVDMSGIMAIRKQYKDRFMEKHGVKLGFMSFFTKAVTAALAEFPAVNSMIDGEELIFHNYCDIGIAVSSPRGLMVPVLRNAEVLNFAEIEGRLAVLAQKAREGKLSMEEMTGGTFTITNGGVFGSMMSTPILNPPQSAILGMHNIVERPVAVAGQVVIRPMMYVALSYDHRVIDGRESVGFLVKVKEYVEEPVKLLSGGNAFSDLLLAL